ncbi:hypothetical protein VTN49DRAFT_5266 [Thermomyces lanuginosus]|uniref:uncharacterized protein n=1 Tax=Thermomyces lanuginosus TaxID=5541 RepID=UPI003743B1FE
MNASASATLAPSEAKQNTRLQKPNYRHIHRFPLPVTVQELPPLIPHNPLSVISFLYSYLRCIIFPPRQEIYSAYFDLATSSVHVTDEKAVRALWEMGFFGKGSLSRSEPTWLEREKKRRGLTGVSTSEEVTGKRRMERREWKLERARKEREAVAQRLKEEAAARGIAVDIKNLTSTSDNDVNGSLNDVVVNDGTSPDTPIRDDLTQDVNRTPDEKSSESSAKSVRFSPVVEEKQIESTTETGIDPQTSEMPLTDVSQESLVNREHLQLSNEETLFLVYGLGVVRVFDGPNGSIISANRLLRLFCQHSSFPPQSERTTVDSDNPFLVSYVVYHHFRSLGWVVRSGVKFGVDYLLYYRGPVFAHAEFAVVIFPSYEHEYWTSTGERRNSVARKQSRSWWWLHGVNRVQAQVRKTLVLCFVDIPPPSAVADLDDIGALLRRYRVREMIIRRWVPNRTRD